jgi:hypothetical protein
MFVLLYVVTVLLIVAGWYSITRAARDVFVTVRLAANGKHKNSGKTVYHYSSSCLLMGKAYRIIRRAARSSKWRIISKFRRPIRKTKYWRRK